MYMHTYVGQLYYPGYGRVLIYLMSKYFSYSSVTSDRQFRRDVRFQPIARTLPRFVSYVKLCPKLPRFALTCAFRHL